MTDSFQIEPKTPIDNLFFQVYRIIECVEKHPCICRFGITNPRALINQYMEISLYFICR